MRLPVLCLLALAASAAGPARFVEHTIATGLKNGYQVVVADLNHDGKPDLIALASGMPDLVWYENPAWERHVIAGGFTRMINCVPVYGDGDPVPVLVLASQFENEARRSAGIVSVLEHNGDPRGPWSVREIDRLTTSHRLRAADIDGSGHRVVIDAPLTGADAAAPEYRGHTPLVFYRPGEWKRQMISDANEGVVHGIFIVDWDGDGREEIITASFTGLHLFKLGKDGRWTRTELAQGDPAPWPKSGSSDVTVGRLGSQRFLAAIEPWHGNQMSVYRRHKGQWERQVIDDSLVQGHTILAADLNGDGRPDIACIGSATANLKWYENQGPAR